jgi:High potential iron-sulfur protein
MFSIKTLTANDRALEFDAVDLSRRRGLLKISLIPLMFCGAVRVSEAASCVDLASISGGEKSLRNSLGFKLKSPDETKTCGGCAFYTTSGGNCGKCTLLSGGAVEAGSVCDSWSAKNS